MAKKQLTIEEQEILRAEWRRNNPEEAARRDAKKTAAEQKELEEAEKEQEEENLLLTALPKGEVAVEAYRKKIKAVLDHITQKREEYVEFRDLAASKLSDDVKAAYVTFVSRNYNGSNQVIAGVVNALVIEGLRYPDKELNNFTFNFLKEREVEKPNWALWIPLWGTEFVPLDAVRLMLKIEDGGFRAIDAFKELVRIISSKILWHLDQEYKRLEWARKLPDSSIRSREVGRKAKRIFYFQTLLGAYGIEYNIPE